jgi:UDPglucose--hexose-1-phosphate uridylyltransferase
MSEMRQDSVTGHWVIIAPERGLRRSDFAHAERPAAAYEADCPFCADLPEGLISEYMGEEGAWQVRVIENKYPALRPQGQVQRHFSGPYEWMAGLGAHEVFIETPEHGGHLYQASASQMALILRAYRDRIHAHARDKRMAYAQVFRNSGAGAGASLRHPHSQLIATPVIPSHIKAEIYGSERQFRDSGSCPYCEILAFELSAKERICLQSRHFVALAPYASRQPYEMLILPRRHRHDFSQISEDELRGLSMLLPEAVARLENAVPGAPYNHFFHTAPFHRGMAEHYHWHIELLPRLTVAAGFEWGTGFYINPVAPESAAKVLRGAEKPIHAEEGILALRKR